MRSPVLFAVLAAFILDPAGFTGSRAGENGGHNGRFVIWAHSDIQPRKESERKDYEAVISDVAVNFSGTGITIVAGDIVQNKKGKDDGAYEWFLEARKAAGISCWYEIAGNHDARNIPAFSLYLKKPIYYSVTFGNVTMLFISDEDGRLHTKISDATFRWWEKKVIENQDRIIITVSHAPPAQSGLVPIPTFGTMSISDSRRFINVLQKYRVDLWLCGHLHIPSSWGFNENRVKYMNNVQFVNVSRIRRDRGLHSESRFIYLEKNSNVMIVRTRDHNLKVFVPGREIKLELKSPFIYDGSAPEIHLPEK
ncbi:MAG: metallophosphoesterase [Spirochaetes bacterium]|jgi:Icc-related predicted phosphoesterase|nr:metallophosphoesterase [Spirochaetota bacterium]